MSTTKNYWYRDNWSGNKRVFQNLNSAKAAAKKETGNAVTIYNQEGERVLTVNASGHCPR